MAPKQPIDDFIEFVRRNLGTDDVQSLIRKLAERKEVAVPQSQREGIAELRLLVERQCSEQELQLYVAALRQRKQNGEPFIRP